MAKYFLMPRTKYTAMEGKSSCQSSALFQYKFTTKTRPLKIGQIFFVHVDGSHLNMFHQPVHDNYA